MQRVFKCPGITENIVMKFAEEIDKVSVRLMKKRDEEE